MAAFAMTSWPAVTARARVWDAATGLPLSGPLQHHGPVVNAAFSPDGTHLATAS
jgi:WD40 repeat protein